MLIMTFATKSLSSVAVGFTRVAAAGLSAVTSLTKAIVNRRDVLRLTELDDRALKDIGLVRSDVEGALATSWLNDPSARLAARADALSGVASARREAGVRQEALRQEIRRDETQRHELIQRASAPGEFVKAPGGRAASSRAGRTSVACCA